KTRWHVAMRPGKRKALDPERELHQLYEKVERLKASVRAKVEHPFRVVKQQFGYAKVRYRGLAKNTARLTMLFAMSNLW
ncbi:transposase, partial [Klebsiella pneumoniae]